MQLTTPRHNLRPRCDSLAVSAELVAILLR